MSIVACIPSTFCPTLGHHQGRIYYKSDITFVLAYYYCVRASLSLKVLAFVFECDSIFSASNVDDILILINNITEINTLQDTFQNNSVLNFTHEVNKNNNISFLDVLIDTNNNNNFTTSTNKKPSSNNSCTLNFKSECPFRYKKAIIHNLISRAKLISSSKTIFYKEVENIKQALINNGFPNYIVDEQIKRMIKNVNQQNKQCTTPSSQQTYIKLFYRNQMHYNYKSDEKILKH